VKTVCLCSILLLACLVGCSPAGRQEDDSVVIFLLDSAVNRDFIEGRVAGLDASDVTHGSLVGRVLTGYCRAPVMSVSVEGLGEAPNKSAYLAGLRTALDYAEHHPRARVLVNVSLGSAEPNPEERDLIGRLTAAGALVVAAAGNADSERAEYPAAYPEVIAVAGATAEGKALSSNFGAHVDIAASGDITFIDYEFLPYEQLRREMEARGTSFAAPRVTATLAYLMRADPGLAPAEAWGIVQRTARPIDDALYRAGLLGAGLLDIYGAKSAVSPSYRFVHFVFPVGVWIVLGVLSVYLCARHGLVGLFLTLMVWLVALPTSVLLVLELRSCLEFVGGGSLVVGLGVTSALAAAAAIAAAVLQWNPVKAAMAVAPPLLALLALVWANRAPVGRQVPIAVAAGCVAVALAAAWEVRTRRRIRWLTALAEGGGVPDAAQVLMHAYRRTLDGRVRRAAIRSLGRVGDEQAVEFLLRETKCPQESTGALAALARRDPRVMIPRLQRLGSLRTAERERLFDALREAVPQEALPLLEAAALSGMAADAAELLRVVAGESKSSPDQSGHG